MTATVVSVGRDGTHRFSKPPAARIRLLAGFGVEGDAHCGVTVKHRSRVAVDPSQPNLRQVHLIHAELLEELGRAGFAVSAGDLGENVLTRGVDLLALSTGTRLRLGADALVEVTGLRNPCRQIEAFRPGLLSAVLGRDEQGRTTYRAGVMGIVLAGGEIGAGDAIGVMPPAAPHRPLVRV